VRVVLLLWSVAAAVLAAEPVAPVREQLQTLRTALDAERAALKALEHSERSYFDELCALDETMATLNDEVRALREAIDRQTQEQQQLNVDLVNEQAAHAQYLRRLERRLRVLFVSGEGAGARALLGAEGFETLALRRRMLADLAEADATLVDRVVAAQRAIAHKQRALQEQRTNLEQLQALLSEQMASLDAAQAERNSALTRLASDKAARQKTARALLKQKREAERRLQALTMPAGNVAVASPAVQAITPLRMPWPAPGEILQRFGQSRDKDSGDVVVSNGIVIGAARGAAVAAVFAGTVVHTGWLRGFGRVVLVDHQDGHHTLMAHLDRAVVQKGDRVTAGQTVGFVGDTDSTTGPKLYFELREHGRPKDPLRYLRR
jgi:septal ring factor EnvC (AmiA/AmiB activator)